MVIISGGLSYLLLPCPHITLFVSVRTSKIEMFCELWIEMGMNEIAFQNYRLSSDVRETEVYIYKQSIMSVNGSDLTQPFSQF